MTEHLEAGRGREARTEVAVNLEKADQAGAATVGDRAGCDRRASFNLVESGGGVGMQGEEGISDLVESGG